MVETYRNSSALQNDCDVLIRSSIVNPAVSVIIPVFNKMGKNMLADCVDSLINQTLNNLEYIFIDDVSTDGSLGYLLEVARFDSRFTVIKMHQNSRQGAARNRGMAISKGQYIGFVDPDDTVTQGYFGEMYKKAVDTGADVVSAQVQPVNEDLVPIGEPYGEMGQRFLGHLTDELREELILKQSHIVSKIYKRDIVIGNGFEEGVYFEDNPASLRWIYRFKHLEQVNNEYYFYRQHSENTRGNAKNNRKYFEDRLYTSDQLIDQAKDLGVYERYKDGIDLYFIELYFLNTLTLLRRGNESLKYSTFKFLSGHLRERVPKWKKNKYLSCQSAKNRFLIALGMDCPQLLYIALCLIRSKKLSFIFKKVRGTNPFK